MKKLLVCIALMGLVAASASAEPMNNNDKTQTPIMTSLSAQPVGETAQQRLSGIIYNNLTNFHTNLYYLTGANGTVSLDDFNVSSAFGTMMWPLYQFQFVGGVVTGGQVLFFTFWDKDWVQVDSFGVQLPYGGAYLWTINISAPQNHIIHNGCYVRMWADDGSVVTPSTGIWYMDASLPIKGTTHPTYPGYTDAGEPLNHKFAVIVPEPASLALLGMGVLTLVVRRRR
jgi:hypothetical protein